MTDAAALEAKRGVGRAYDELLASRQAAGDAAPEWACRVVKLPGGLECRITIARAPEPGEIRVPLPG